MEKRITYGSLSAFRITNRLGNGEMYVTKTIPADDSPFWKECLDNHIAILVEVPKTGSLSINYSINPKYAFGHLFASQYPIQMRQNLKAIVRNPYDRLVSAYEFMMRGGFNNNPNYAKVSQYKTFHSWVLGGMNPKMFWIPKDKPFWEVEAGWKECFLPQHYWLVDEQGQLIVLPQHIGRFETLKEDVKRLLGFELELHYNSSPNKKPWREYYTDPLVAEKVYRLYQKDFEMFGYSKEIGSDLSER